MRAIFIKLAALLASVATLSVAATGPATASHWEATAGGTTQTFGSGGAGAMWQMCSIYGCSCGATVCVFLGCDPVYNVSGQLALHTCKGLAGGGGWRSGYATLKCDADEYRTAEGCAKKVEYACRGRGVQAGNPIDADSGYKRQADVDFETAGADPLRFGRKYASGFGFFAASKGTTRLGWRWRSSFDSTAFYTSNPATTTPLRMHFVMPSGREYVFILSGGVYKLAYFNWTTKLWVQPWKGEYAAVAKVGSTYEVTTENDAVYVYNFAGQLTEIRYRGGYTQTLTYDTNGLNTDVTDSLGRTLTFSYNNQNLLDTMTTPDSRVVKFKYLETEDMSALLATWGFTYDPAAQVHTNWILEKVVYPDDTPGTDTDNPTLVYHYENTSFSIALTGVTDERGVRYATYGYDANGDGVSTTHAGAAGQHAIAYNAGANTSTVTNPLAKDAVYTFESDGMSGRRLKQEDGQASTNCPASQRQYAYDTNNYVSQITDEEGRVAKYVKDTRGRPTSITEAFGTALARTTTMTWHTTFNLPAQVVAPDLTTDFTYDTSGRLTERTETDTTSHSVPYSTNGQTRITAYTYTAEGLVDTVDGPLAGTSDLTDYDYNASGYVNKVTNGLGQITNITSLDAAGRPLTVVDPNGVTTDITYTPRGWVETVTVDPGADQAVTTFQYDEHGQVTQVTLPNGVTMAYAYDDARRLIRITNGAGEKIEYAYDNMNNVTQVDTKNSGGTIVVQVQHTYDELGRLMKTIGASSQQTQYAYDKLGNNTQVTDPRAKVYGNTFDELNRLKRETDPDSYQTNVAFTAQDDVASVTDARSNATAYVRDGWGDVIRETSPDRGITDYVYDARGLMTQRIDARGQVTNFTYDGLGRMTTRSFPGASSETITWSYDSTTGGNKGVGELTGVTDPSGTVAYTYNALGQMTHMTRAIGARTYDTDYAYDKAGNLVEMTMPSGRIVTYARDSLARVTAVTTKDNAGALTDTVASSIAWRPFGPLASLTFGNSIDLALSYDNDGRVTDIDAAGGGTTVQDLVYGYDDASNITSIGDNLTSGRSQTFAYDDLNRLTQAAGAYGANTYAYDGVGNRTQKTVTVPFSSSDTYTVASTSNRLTSISGGTTRTLTYEDSGQAATDARSLADDWAYTTDKAGRMSAAILNTVTQATFAYDADEQRIVNANALTSHVTHYIYDAQGQLVAEMDASTGDPIREYVWLGGLPVGYVDRLGASGASRLFFVHADHLARPQKITDSARAVVWDGVFAPFGEVHAITGSIVNVLMFPGQIYDPETGLAQNWHRDYDANIGRYLQSDPIGLEGGFNTYAYAGGNPLTRVDRDGRFWNFALGVAFGVAIGYALDEDGCYTWDEAIRDAALGAIGEGAFRAAFAALRSARFMRFMRAFGRNTHGGPPPAALPLTARNFRANLGRATGGIPKDAHAHHVFPLKYADHFERAGINLNDPQFGAWWSASSHLRKGAEYNSAWREFLRANQNAGAEEIMQFGRQIAKRYGLSIGF